MQLVNKWMLNLAPTTLIGGKCRKEEEATGESSVSAMLNEVNYFTLESTTSSSF